jgi:membrane protein
MTAYDLWETYSMGIVQGKFTLRAMISYSFFMAIFPFILFYADPFRLSVDNFQVQFLDL